MTTTAITQQWGSHFHGLHRVEDVRTVTTEHGADLRVRLAEAARDLLVVAVTGDPGTGKSFAAGQALDAVLESRPELTAVWLELASSVRGATLAKELYPQLVGAPPPKNALLLDMRNDMAYELARTPRILVLDEAQHVTTEAMQLLRWLYDRPDAKFALTIVATPKLWRRIPPELESRITTDIRIERINDDQAPILLAGYHPIFTTAEPELLAHLNRTQARGEFRWWAKFLGRAAGYLPKLGGTLTADAAEIICEQLRRGVSR